MYIYSRSLGIVLVTLGLVFFLFAVAPFILRIMVALIGLSLINSGLRMQGRPPLIFWMQSWSGRF